MKIHELGILTTLLFGGSLIALISRSRLTPGDAKEPAGLAVRFGAFLAGQSIALYPLLVSKGLVPAILTGVYMVLNRMRSAIFPTVGDPAEHPPQMIFPREVVVDTSSSILLSSGVRFTFLSASVLLNTLAEPSLLNVDGAGPQSAASVLMFLSLLTGVSMIVYAAFLSIGLVPRLTIGFAKKLSWLPLALFLSALGIQVPMLQQVGTAGSLLIHPRPLSSSKDDFCPPLVSPWAYRNDRI